MRRSDTDDSTSEDINSHLHTQTIHSPKGPNISLSNTEITIGSNDSLNYGINCSDNLQSIIVEELDQVLNRCSFKVNQRLLLRDLFVSRANCL